MVKEIDFNDKFARYVDDIAHRIALILESARPKCIRRVDIGVTYS